MGAWNWFAVKLQYHITPFDASFLGRAAGNHIRKKRSLVSAQTKFDFQLRQYILNHHAEPGASHFAFPEMEQQLFGYANRLIEFNSDIAAALGKIDLDNKFRLL